MARPLGPTRRTPVHRLVAAAHRALAHHVGAGGALANARGELERRAEERALVAALEWRVQVPEVRPAA
jgi:hypothetical protein